MRPPTALLAALALGGCSPPASSIGTSDSRDQVPRPGGLEQQSDNGVSSISPTEILIESERGQLRARLADNDTARALATLVPLRLQMRDHQRQEKTGVLSSALPDGMRQRDFAVGTLALWGDRNFVIYYAKGRVPAPGIVVLGQVEGDLSHFDNADAVTVSLRRP